MSRATMRAAGEAVPTETRDIIDAIDLLCRAINMNELIVMAGESAAMGDAKDAVTTGCGVVDEMLKEVKAVLYASSIHAPSPPSIHAMLFQI